MIQIDLANPLGTAVVLAVLFLAAYGAFWLSHTILQGAGSLRVPDRPEGDAVAAMPPAVSSSYSVFGATDYHKLVQPSAPVLPRWRPFDTGWAGEPTDWYPTLGQDLLDDLDFEPTPRRPRTRFADLLAGPPASQTPTPPAETAQAPQTADTALVTIHDPRGRYGDLHAPLAVP